MIESAEAGSSFSSRIFSTAWREGPGARMGLPADASPGYIEPHTISQRPIALTGDFSDRRDHGMRPIPLPHRFIGWVPNSPGHAGYLYFPHEKV
jgi:hypothetical protein